MGHLTMRLIANANKQKERTMISNNDSLAAPTQIISDLDMSSLVSFDDWESGKVKLTDEYFERRTVGCRYFFGSSDGSNRIIETVVYVGRETGIILGDWFAEVMEPAC